MIRITRGNHFMDERRAYKIFIDDVHRGDIRKNETKEFAVDNGSHTVRATIDWCGSLALHVYVDDSVVELEVENAAVKATGWKKWFFPEYTSFFKDKYLFLSIKDSDVDSVDDL